MKFEKKKKKKKKKKNTMVVLALAAPEYSGALVPAMKNKRKRRLGQRRINGQTRERNATISIDLIISPPPSPNKTSEGNSYWLRSRTRLKKFQPQCKLNLSVLSDDGEGREVVRVSGSKISTPIKSVKFRPKVMSVKTPEPMTPPPSCSRGRIRGDSSVKSCRRGLDFSSDSIGASGDPKEAIAQPKPLLVYTRRGFSLSRKVRRNMEAHHEKEGSLLECNEKEEEERWKKERKLFEQRAMSFITSMRSMQGNRAFMGWKGSVVDSVVGVFLTQNAADNMSSSAFMSLAAKYPTKKVVGDEKNKLTQHAVDWNAVRCAQVDDISNAIQDRGMNNRIAARIKKFLNGIYDKKSGLLDLEWLRAAKPEKAKEFLSTIYGLGLKSTECLRLLTLRQHAFPVDRHVARIVVRLGWVPLEKLPDGVLMHRLKEYPLMERVQEYLSQRLCNLDVETLYELHYQMITFGKVFCTKKKPNCNSCPLKKECKHFASEFPSCLSYLEEDIEDLCLVPNVSNNMSENNILLKDEAFGPIRKLKIAGRLRTEHQVYELPDSHPLVLQLDKRDPDDRNPYLLAIWPPGKTENPSSSPKEECNSLESTDPGNADSNDEETVLGTFLVPCWTATRGSFPLDGTFFQINEVFADDGTSQKPLAVPRKLLWDLTRKTLFCGTSISAIFEGLSTQEIQDCFWEGILS